MAWAAWEDDQDNEWAWEDQWEGQWEDKWASIPSSTPNPSAIPELGTAKADHKARANPLDATTPWDECRSRTWPRGPPNPMTLRLSKA